ncbi:hypothetical protein CKA32_000683 [Geitlerinema sp. FC II]|nr:hypothetical protein CKA32_000683 [Geitlerinema sp. FC II]
MGFSTSSLVSVRFVPMIVSIPRRDFWVFQLTNDSTAKKQRRFQSLEGIFGFFNIALKPINHLRDRFQSLEGIFGFFNQRGANNDFTQPSFNP